MLIYAGIETKLIEYYVSAVAKNHIRKKFKLGEVKTAIAKTPGTDNIVYEVVYVEVIDPAENTTGKTKNKITINNKQEISVDQERYTSDGYTVAGEAIDLYDPDILTVGTRRFSNVTIEFLPSLTITTRDGNIFTIPTSDGFYVGIRDQLDSLIELQTGTFEPYRFRPTPENTIRVDSDALTIDGKNDLTRYISNISNMRNNIKELGETEINYLPLWMRTAQPGSIESCSSIGFSST